MGALQSNVMKQIAESVTQQTTNQTIKVINQQSGNCTALQNTTVQFGVPASSGGVGCTWENFGQQINVNLTNTLKQQCTLTAQASTVLQVFLSKLRRHSTNSYRPS
jgi:hypothetical protein